LGNCGNINNINFFNDRDYGFLSDKVFPEEVDNIKDFMGDTFTTNINAYSLSNPIKKKGKSKNNLLIPNNFLQEDEKAENLDMYFEQENNNSNYRRNNGGMDSGNLNRRYMKMDNIRRKKYNEENQNYVDDNINQGDIYDENQSNVENKNENNIRILGNHRDISSINKTSNENKNDKNNEINILSNSIENKEDTNEQTIRDSKKNNKNIDMNKRPIDIEEEVNNHKMLRGMKSIN